jgi:hypothetical protein
MVTIAIPYWSLGLVSGHLKEKRGPRVEKNPVGADEWKAAVPGEAELWLAPFT